MLAQTCVTASQGPHGHAAGWVSSPASDRAVRLACHRVQENVEVWPRMGFRRVILGAGRYARTTALAWGAQRAQALSTTDRLHAEAVLWGGLAGRSRCSV